MEFENKYEIVDKEPEVGDLVTYNTHPRGAELGLVTQTYNLGFEDDLKTAYVMWAINDGEDELFADLAVVSSGSIIYDA